MKKGNLVEKLTLAMQIGTLPDFVRQLQFLNDLELRDRDGRTLLINAAFYNCLDAAKILIKSGANVNASDTIGYTALHAAAQEENIDIMRILLDNGANANAKNKFGNTPLLVTKPSQPKEVFTTLLSYGADPEIKNDYGISAMDCMAAYPEIIKMFMLSKNEHKER